MPQPVKLSDFLVLDGPRPHLRRQEEAQRPPRYVLTTGIGATEIAYDLTDEELLTATRSMLADLKAHTAWKHASA